jgi:nitronate monooxygenase
LVYLALELRLFPPPEHEEGDDPDHEELAERHYGRCRQTAASRDFDQHDTAFPHTTCIAPHSQSIQPQIMPAEQFSPNAVRQRVFAFCAHYNLRLPILLAPMAGASAPSLSIAVAEAGGLGAAGVLLMQPAEILRWAEEVRAATSGPFQLNIWIPDPKPVRDAGHEARIRAFLAQWGPEVPAEAANATPPDFAAQCDAMLEAAPPILSSVMGLYPPEFVARMKQRGIAWWANISTVAEARAAEAAGADVVVAQGAEAGGHRGCFDAREAERQMVGLFSLVPAVVDAVRIPVVATGGIADARGVAAALMLGASAVQIGTGFLRTPEAKIAPAWADALARTAPEQTVVSRVFSGRAGRSIATKYVRAATAAEAPEPAPYPVQRGLTATMRSAAVREGDVERMQAWAGQSAALARAMPAGELTIQLWAEAQRLLGG